MQKFFCFYPKFAFVPLKILTKISSRNLKPVRNPIKFYFIKIKLPERGKV